MFFFSVRKLYRRLRQMQQKRVRKRRGPNWISRQRKWPLARKVEGVVAKRARRAELAGAIGVAAGENDPWGAAPDIVFVEDATPIRT